MRYNELKQYSVGFLATSLSKENEYPIFENEFLHPRTNAMLNGKIRTHMDVFTIIIQNTALQGMPKWYQALTISLFTIIATVAISAYFKIGIHATEMSEMATRFGY
ncbi:hypothetical protein [Zobellia uliginosa]|uniref:hypothetical protein n=1 Tax=Zobellia uliginosa TaxID=143224 RepID=UPI001C06AF64|nr:hypothetical protein [Zobellia uliginosa]MBU2946441.1 hypothetical protein [Zobellia uliginosa]